MPSVCVHPGCSIENKARYSYMCIGSHKLYETVTDRSLLSSFLLLFLCSFLINWCWLDELDFFSVLSRHPLAQCLGDNDSLLRLKVLQYGTDDSSGGTHRGIEHVDKLSLGQHGRQTYKGWRVVEQGILPSPPPSPPPMCKLVSLPPPAGSSSWSVHSAPVAAGTGSRCSWSRRPARGRHLTLETMPQYLVVRRGEGQRERRNDGEYWYTSTSIPSLQGPVPQPPYSVFHHT